eukprot:5843222-Prymnesium_polylepis.1
MSELICKICKCPLSTGSVATRSQVSAARAAIAVSPHIVWLGARLQVQPCTRDLEGDGGRATPTEPPSPQTGEDRGQDSGVRRP